MKTIHGLLLGLLAGVLLSAFHNPISVMNEKFNRVFAEVSQLLCVLGFRENYRKSN